ncbi:MAG: 16S rRNA (cytosine(967)-C(5))-methyltransferase RsmB [Rhodothermales bacterium]
MQTNNQSKPASMRLLAARELDAIAEQDAFIGLQRATRSGNPNMDRSIRDTVAGVIRWQRYLDFLISRFYRGDAAGLESSMRTILRIGIHGLLFTRQPDHAVINETVEAAKIHVRQGAAGLANGILRGIVRKRDALPTPHGPISEALATKHSHPSWMVERWIELFGQEKTEALLTYNNGRPTYGVHLTGDAQRAQTALRVSEVAFEVSEWMSDMVRMRSLQPLIRARWFRDGKAYVQDEAAALVVQYAAPVQGQSVLDLCAAPGGKTVQLALGVGDEGSVLACDVQENRLKLVRENADRMGLKQVDTVARDAREGDPSWEQAFDLVLLDAPCSGLGVLSKRADMRWRRELQNIEELVVLQRSLLEAAARCVKPGGLLIYSTCTIEPAENAGQVDAFISSHQDFSREATEASFPKQWLTPEGDYLSLPFESGMDGAYAARLRRA